MAIETDSTSLTAYLRYDSYISARQLQELIGELDRMYDAIYEGMTDEAASDLDLPGRMRIKELRTGNSITLELVEGITMLATSGMPLIQIPAAVGILSMSAKLLVGAAKGLVEVRKAWHEGTRAKYEAVRAMKEEQIGMDSHVEEVEIPRRAKAVAVDSAHRIINMIEYAPNITVFRINGTTIVGGEEQDEVG